MGMFDAAKVYRIEMTTRAIRVCVAPMFLAEQSQPARGLYLWSYDIQIDNLGPETVQLLNRQWQITNARGAQEAIEGTGVIGQQPVLGPGGQFCYQSSVSLSAPSGLMQGQYGMKNERGERFWIPIPVFSLDSPHETQPLN